MLTLSGCPGGAELEDPGKYGLTGGMTSTTGGTGTGGTGTGGSGGSAGMAALVVDCGSDTYQNVLTSNCATAGCHKPPANYSGLNLTPDAGLVSRIKDVKAQHGDIVCPPDFTACTPATCDPNALLVNSANPSASWILAKLQGTQNGCGDPMPPGAIDPADVTCLTNFINAVAALPK